jgi:hypothetical protein
MNVMKTILLSVLILSLARGPLFPQEIDTSDVIPLKFNTVKSETLIKEYKNLVRTDRLIKAIDNQIRKQGFKPKFNNKGSYGFSQTYLLKNDSMEFKLSIQDYSKCFSKDHIAVCRAENIAPESKGDSYTFYLRAPGGVFDAIEEYTIDDNLVITRANSFWSCLKRQMNRKCKTTCVSDLLYCAPTAATFAGYVACVVGSCATCVASQCICCLCNCKLYCLRCCER